MDIASFENLLDRHGGDLSRWPAPERAAATALLATSPAAQALLAEMQAVETMLRAPLVPDAAGAVDRFAARATRHPQQSRTRRLATRAAVGAAAAAVLVVGALVGGVTAPAPLDTGPDRVLAAAFDADGAADVD